MAVREHHGIRYVGWVVVCFQCGQKATDCASREHQSLAYRRFLKQGWYADWHEGVIEIMDAAFWLCPHCHNPIGTVFQKRHNAATQQNGQ